MPFTSTFRRAAVGGRPWSWDNSLKSVRDRAALVERLIANRITDVGEACLFWGSPSRFALLGATEQPRVRVVPRPEPPPPPANAIPFTEISKETEDIRVENPDDPEQYVIVQRRVSSVFENSEDGKQYQFIYLNEESGEEEE